MFGLKKRTKGVRKMKRVAKKVTSRKVKRTKRVAKKVISRKVKRRVSVKAPKNLALSGAIKDLETEIRKLSKEKAKFKSSLGNVSSTIDVDRQMERELQHKIARLIEKEAKFNQRKKNLQTRIDRVSDKMSKISKIRSEMTDI